jgi:hypothetical protein
MAPTRDSSSSQVPYGEKGDREGEVSAADCLGRSSEGARDDLPRRRIPPSLLGFAADFTASSRKLQFLVLSVLNLSYKRVNKNILDRY